MHHSLISRLLVDPSKDLGNVTLGFSLGFHDAGNVILCAGNVILGAGNVIISFILGIEEH